MDALFRMQAMGSAAGGQLLWKRWVGSALEDRQLLRRLENGDPEPSGVGQLVLPRMAVQNEGKSAIEALPGPCCVQPFRQLRPGHKNPS